ncbi:hypothetical protein [Variovorax sp. Root411]|uniref:hypothetical protein n=1 Tax=Variovorax sp. Root411 TaxID=1736530 RepID=UPI0006F6AFFE|nr:hypothetical protein [Variovorax sp. Root411]KQW55915.1 hypothetical protein ASC92_17805 [Variovorax sp. Root411]
MRKFRPSDLQPICLPQAGNEAAWLGGAEDSNDFLRANALADEIVIFAVGPAVLIVGVLALTEKLTPPDGEELQNAIVYTDESWKIQRSYGGGEGHRVYLEPPFESPSCPSLSGGEPLVHRRSLNGVQKGPPPIEMSQKLIHCLDLYYLPERKAYCRLDARGDIEDVIRIVALDLPDTWEGREVVTILRKDLDVYMALAGMSLVLKFDFTRVKHESFNGWDDSRRYDQTETDLFYHGGGNGTASYANGAMIVRPDITPQELVQEFKDDLEPGKKEYATFKIYDRKNKKNVETSCSPAHIVSYFERSDLPWQISPAFFRPEVLVKYKGDPEKYTLEDRSIMCRGAWYLKGYDINEEGQVHVYMVDLARLPIEEQRYWQLFNEWPKSDISARAHQTDILGEWNTGYDPLNALKHKISKLDKGNYAWWSPRGDEVAGAVRYPATDSPKEWADEILALDQLLVEGFLERPLRKLAEATGRSLEDGWRAMKLIQEIMIANGRSAAEAKAVMTPMLELHGLRSEIRGHAAIQRKKAAVKNARTEHGNFRAQFADITSGCDKALEEVLKVLGVTLQD